MRMLFLESHPMWIHGLPNGFRDAGHEVMISGPLTEDNVPQMIKDFQPDLIITMGWGPENTSLKKQEWIHENVHATRIPHIYWATEDPTHTTSFTLPYLKKVQPDFVFTICPSSVKKYKELGIKAAHLDFAYHSSVNYPTNYPDIFKSRISVVANAYPNKMKMYPHHYRHQSMKTLIQPLLQKNIRIDFYGKYWDQMEPFLGIPIPEDWIHGYIPYTEANKIYNSADIIIGLQNHPTQLTQRIYEILGSGGFLITNNTPEIHRLFKSGKDLITSSSPEETLQWVQYYLEHPKLRRLIQKQGNKSVKKHTYRHRAEYILGILHEHGIFNDNRDRSNYEKIRLEKETFINDQWELYTVCNGDTLWGISKHFAVSIDQIKKLNGLTSDMIDAGQLLKIKEITFPSQNQSSILISSGKTKYKNLSLTYDAGNKADGAHNLLNTLAKNGIKTTFFLTGKWVEEFPHLAKRIADEGHEIGNHSYSHPDFTRLPHDKMIEEISRAEAVIREITGKDCRPLFRPPYGAWNKQVLEVVGKCGYPYCIYWSVDTMDWKQHSVDFIVKRIKEQAKSNDIVLMHLEYLHTASATEIIIPELLASGYKLVPVRELLKVT